MCVISKAKEASARAAESGVVAELFLTIGRDKGPYKLWTAIRCFVRRGILPKPLCSERRRQPPMVKPRHPRMSSGPL